MTTLRRKEINVRDLITMRVGKERAEEFAEWAWGKDFKTMNFSTDAVRKWNKRHGKKLRIDPANEVVDDLSKMIDLWEESLCKK